VRPPAQLRRAAEHGSHGAIEVLGDWCAERHLVVDEILAVNSEELFDGYGDGDGDGDGYGYGDGYGDGYGYGDVQNFALRSVP
jgi:hypothetical protein